MPASNTYEPIATTTLTSATASVSFGSIPQTYTDLVIVSQMQLTTGSQAVFLRFNSDDSANYSVTRVYGNGSTATSDRFSSQTGGIDISYISNSAWTIANTNIQNYSNSTTYKTVLGRWGSSAFTTLIAGLWRSTNVITSLTLTPYGSDTFISGSTFTLYGIKAA